MRPTLSEQLRGLRRILEQVVAPAVDGDYELSTLLGVARALEMLEDRASGALAFLHWDNAETQRLLTAISVHVPIDAPLEPVPPVDITDVAAVDAENDRLRWLLAAAIPALANDAAASAVHGAVVAHLRERTVRYPFTSTGSLPSR
jgi:hypothetical protein